MKTEELQSKLHDRSKEGSPQGWVHVNKVSEVNYVSYYEKLNVIILKENFDKEFKNKDVS